VRTILASNKNIKRSFCLINQVKTKYAVGSPVLLLVQALQDYYYMGQHIQMRPDSFYVTGERIVDRCVLQVAMEGKEIETDPLRWAQSMGE
jgi:hypothetical protein